MLKGQSVLMDNKSGLNRANIKQSIALRDEIVKNAMSGLDARYVNGGVESYKGSDCANFAINPFKQVGLIDDRVKIPHQHKDWMLGKDINPFLFREYILQFAFEVPFDSRQTGDLVTFLYRNIESHVGIITQTNPDWFIHNPSGGAVKFQKLTHATSLKSVYRHKKIIELERNER